MRYIKAIIDFFYEIFFGCRHDSLTRPFTLENQTYKVCLDCGRQIYYSSETMRPLTIREIRRMRAALGADVAVLSPAPANHRLIGGAKQKTAA